MMSGPSSFPRQNDSHVLPSPPPQLQANEYNAATDCRKAYVDFDMHVKDLTQIATALAFEGAAPEQVRGQYLGR